MPRFFRAAVASILLTLVGVLSDARAAETVSPVRGVLIPNGALAGDADATALELNPAQLGFLSAGSWALSSAHWDDSTPRPGRGMGLFVGAPLWLGSAVGLGFTWLDPTLPGSPDSYSKFQLGWAWKLGSGLSVGFSWDHLFGTAFGGIDSLSSGVGLRLHPVIAAGFVVREINRPALAGGFRVPRSWEGELALRPLATDRLEIALGGKVDEDGDNWGALRPRLRLSARLRPGLYLFGEADMPHDPSALPAGGGVSIPTRNDFRALAGIQVNVGGMGVGVAGVGNWGRAIVADDRTSGTGPGASVIVRGSGARRPALIEARHIEKITLSNLDGERTFLEMIVRLRRAEADDRAAALLLEIQELDLGLARIEELRTLVARIRRRKPVFAHLMNASTRTYYLAAACDRVFFHPAGTFALTGLSQEVTFYKGSLDKLGVSVELERIAEYKGAMEPFVLDRPSEPVERNRNQLLDQVFGNLLGGIARDRAARGLVPETLRALVDRGVFTPPEALRAHFVDAVVDENEIEGLVKSALGRKLPVRASQNGPWEPDHWRPSRVAVVFVEDAIVDAPPSQIPFFSQNMAHADRVIEALNRARKDSSIRAVVLRINSPGGSVFGSDRIAREVSRVRKAGKPVIVSMGDVAASGGYYIAAPADEIFASPSTITGSIGIYGYKVDARGLATRLGIAHVTYKRGEHADLHSPFRPWTDGERALVRERIGYFYRLFTETIVAGRKARGLTSSRVDDLGGGRVFTGDKARSLGLVDRLGGLNDAIAEAARRGRVPLEASGLPTLVALPPPIKSPLQALLSLPGASIFETRGRAAARLIVPLMMGPGHGVEARLPYEIELR